MDPIGLAGGLNLYGFAGGDPVNFSDPFGLCPVCVFEVAASVYDAIDVGVTAARVATGRADREELGLSVAGALAGTVSLGGGMGRAGRMAFVRALGEAGEAAVGAATGLAKNTSTRLGSRIPDFVDAASGTFHESKNVANLSMTRQLREMIDNLGEGQSLVIHVRQNTSVSRAFDGLSNVKVVPTLPARQ